MVVAGMQKLEQRVVRPRTGGGLGRIIDGGYVILDERDFGGIYEFTDLIDRYLPPAGLVLYDELNPSEETSTAVGAGRAQTTPGAGRHDGGEQ